MTAEETLSFYASLIPTTTDPHHHHQQQQQQQEEEHEDEEEGHTIPVSALALELAERAASKEGAGVSSACCLHTASGSISSSRNGSHPNKTRSFNATDSSRSSRRTTRVQRAGPRKQPRQHQQHQQRVIEVLATVGLAGHGATMVSL